jgi:hypothetical protein
MGEAADDAFDAALSDEITTSMMRDAGCRRCTQHHIVDECPVCLDLGWINSNGEPCEP